MALVNFIRKWLNRRISALNCALNGHVDVKVVEEYERITLAKNYRGNRLDSLVQTHPFTEISVKGKLKCRTCGRIFIGIVKVNETQWTP
jgi:hypothetical protein